MKYCANWEERRARWTALWNGQTLDRPILTVEAPNGKPARNPPPVSAVQWWSDPDYIARMFVDTFETTYYGGESFPSGLILAGWVTNAYGANVRLMPETIWIDPLPVDWLNDPPALTPDYGSEWFHRVEAIHRAVIEAAGRDDFLVGDAAPLPGNDMLALLMGGNEFLLATVDRPAWVKASILQLAQNRMGFLKFFRDMARAKSAYWYGLPGWMPFWAPEPFACMQADISCMISPEMYDEFIVPELEVNHRESGAVWYHLDGQSAFHHLPRLLSLPFVRVIQFTPEAGTPANGPVYLDLYRRIQKAGKIVHIDLPRENVLPLVRELDPNLLVLKTWCPTPQEADELIAASAHECRAGRRR